MTDLAAAAPNAPAVSFEAVRFAWPSGGFALSVDAWSVARGAQVCLIGASGGGKTTLLNLLTGMVVATSGVVRLFGQDVSRLSAPKRDRLRADHVGVIFQMFNLLPFAGVADNVRLGLAFSDRRAAALERGVDAEIDALLSRLRLEPSLMRRTPVSRLSVGQQQRVAAARALIGRPDVIVADEPTSALDAHSRDAFLDVLFEETAATGATLLVVSHDEAVAARFPTVARLEEIARSERAA